MPFRKKKLTVSQKIHIAFNYKEWMIHCSILKLKGGAMCKTHYMLGVKCNKPKKLTILSSIT